jgi:hypothetical protein
MYVANVGYITEESCTFKYLEDASLKLLRDVTAEMLQQAHVCCCFKSRKQCHSESDSFLQLSRVRENSELILGISSASSSEQQ